MLKKYEIVEGEKARETDFKISPKFDPGEKGYNIVIFRGFVIKGWMGKFEIEGNPNLLQLGYDSGLGAKNSMGHGLFEVIDNQK